MLEFVYESITKSHDTGFFRCGDDALDCWLTKEALPAHTGGLSRTHVSMKPEDEYQQVTGFFTLCPTTIVEINKSREEGYPGYLLCKLARCESQKGTSHGADLLVEAMVKAVQASDAAGGRYLVVDPVVDDIDADRTSRVRKFYADAGFVDIEGTNRMFMTIKAIRSQM